VAQIAISGRPEGAISQKSRSKSCEELSDCAEFLLETTVEQMNSTQRRMKEHMMTNTTASKNLNVAVLSTTVACLRLCGRFDGRLMALLGAVSASATTVGLTG